MKEYDIIQELSGKEGNRTKVYVAMYHTREGSDNSTRPLDELSFEKPYVNIYKDVNNICIIDFIYDAHDDKDFLQQYLFLQNFFTAKHSASFSEEEFNLWQQQNADELAGLAIPSEEKIVLYSDVLTIQLISLFPQGKFVLTTTEKPMFYQLLPLRPNEPARILRLVFQKDDVILEEADDVVLRRDIAYAHDSIEREMN